MTISYTSLVHGLDVRTSDLVVAGRVFEQLEPAFGIFAALQAQRHALASRATNSNQLPAAYRVPVELWDMIKQYMTDSAVVETRAAVQVELICGDCLRNEINRRVGSQPGTDEDAYELEGFVTSQVEEEAKAARERVLRSAEWVESAEPCRHLSAATRYANFRAQGLQSKALSRLLSASGLYLPSPTSKGIVRPLVKSSFTTTIALELPRATIHQVRSAFEFSPFTLCRSFFEPGPLEDSTFSRPAIKLGPAVKECGRLVQFLRKWHFGSPTMVIGPAQMVAGMDERAGVALVGGEKEAFRPRWIVAATQDD